MINDAGLTFYFLNKSNLTRDATEKQLWLHRRNHTLIYVNFSWF